MSGLRDRIAARQGPCMAVSGTDRCTRRDPHGPEDMHWRGAHRWGSRGESEPARAAWLVRQLTAREMAR